MKIEKIKLKIEGMTCDHCALTVEKKLDTLNGVLKRKVSYAKKLGEVEFDSEQVNKNDVIAAINSTKHYTVAGEIKEGQSEKQPVMGEKSLRENTYDYDLIIIGGGSAAFSAAIKASELEKKSLIINDGLPIGGTCVNVGCVPSKTLIRNAEEFYNANHPSFDSIQPGINQIDFKRVIEQKTELVNSLRTHKYIDVIKDDGNIKTINGWAKLKDKNTVMVNDKLFTAHFILLAMGSSTYIPNIPGLKYAKFYTNETLYNIDSLPEHLIILGGRYIALENAQMFRRLGTKVTVLQRSNRILPDESPDLTEALTNYLKDEGVEIKTGVKVLEVKQEADKTVLEIEIQDIREKISGSHLFIATGRKGNTKGLELEKLGIELHGEGFIKTDDFNRTTVDNIYAAGDITGENLFVYTAAYAGALSVKNAFSEEKEKKDYSVLPWVIFTNPQVAGVGMDENQAYKNGIDYDTAKLWLKDVPRSIAARDTRGFIKLIRDKSNNKLIGARILAPEGSELLMEIAMAIKFGITVDELKDMFHPYLTLSEAVKLAAITFDKDVSKLSCCAV